MGWGTGNLGGGGTSLNFKVVGGLTQPANPQENTIWVKTDVKITSWEVSGDVPSYPAEGMVWIASGVSGHVEINVLKKNAIQIFPSYVKQYVGGIWAQLESLIYQGGEWIDLIILFYDNGQFDESIPRSEKKTPTTATIVYGDEDITLSTVAGKPSEVYVVFGPVNLGATSKVILEGTFAKKSTSSFTNVATIFVASSADSSYKDAAAIASFLSKGNLDAGHQYNVELDVSGMSGEYYVLAGVNTQGSAWSDQRINTITTIRGE